MEADRLSNRYTGSSAEQYDSRRSGLAKWSREQDVMARILSRFPRGTMVLDVPVGTGRFIEFYKQYGLRTIGVDVSADMLRQCEKKAIEHEYDMPLVRCSIVDLGLSDDCCEAVVCVRFLNWLEYEELTKAMAELRRVSRGHLVLGLRHVVPLAELGSYRVLRQTLMKIRRRFTKDGLVYHKKKEITAAFEVNGLTIEEQHCLEQRRDGTDYVFYLLKVNDTKNTDDARRHDQGCPTV
jgi:ubiquinone/menaquinone biosynthesis C-methylase UbiE